jgi:hypothetical protein
MTRREFLAGSVAAGVAASAACRDTRSNRPLPTRPQGIAQVLVVDGGRAPRFARYVEELLVTEGVLGIACVQAGEPVRVALGGATGVVCCGDIPDTGTIRALVEWVQCGGVLTAICPGAPLLVAFGAATPTGVRYRPGGFSFSDAPDEPPLRLHVPAEEWLPLSGASVDGWFVDDATGGRRPALLSVPWGSGTARFWAFDCARNVALIRQGNPEWVDQDRDGLGGVRLVDAMVGWLDPERLARPDADVYQQALAAPLLAGTEAVGPAVGAGHFPHGAEAVFIATSDAHGVGAGVLESLLRRLEAQGARASIYYEPPITGTWRRRARRVRWALGDWPGVGSLVRSAAAPPPPSQVQEWRRRGHEFAPHPNVDSGLEVGLARAWQRFAADGYGGDSVTTRTHRVLWRGVVGTARAQRGVGVRLNLDAYHLGPAFRRRDGQWAQGHMIGSGLAVKFVDPEGGLVDCYGQPTQVVDEQLLGAFGGVEGRTGQEAARVAEMLVRRAVSGTPTALCGNFHADGFAVEPERVEHAAALLEGALAACRREGVPVWPAARWLEFLEARRATVVVGRQWDAERGRLECLVELGAVPCPRLALVLPAACGERRLEVVSVDGARADWSVRSLAGREWVRVGATPGPHRLEARYR